MGVIFTPEQQKVIDLRERNILVSAAAGSGKTAVLVERIITRLTKDAEPIDVDQLLIVTYTEAAASEMKERIRTAIEKALEEEPDNVHLQRQATLIHSAQVTTIHSFCLSVIREYFHTIDLDPGFRIAEEGELKLLKHDVMEELLERYYEEGKEQFQNFVECFASGKDDRKLEELILQVYEFSRSYPNPESWLQYCVEQYAFAELEEMEQSEFVKYILWNVKNYLYDLQEMLVSGLAVCDSEDGPYMYRETLEADLLNLERILQTESFLEMADVIRQIKWVRLATNRDKSVSPEAAAYVKSVREEVKKTVSMLVEQYFFDAPEEMYRDMLLTKKNMKMLAQLVNDFASEFALKKAGKNMIDFGDMEQFALQILTCEENGELVPSKVAREYQERFAEVMIDEYQDSNLIQEAILTSVSKVSKGIYNIFMVGDVKQSIYRFRLSRPELFMEKFETYSLEEGIKQRIDLHKNFRSRREVLESTNFIFEQIMTKRLGGITYDEKAALYVGASYEPKEGNETEVLLIDTDFEEEEQQNVEETNRELEARAIAGRIKALVGHHMIFDKDTGEYRPTTYGDIVILTRSLKGWTDVFANILNREGVPTYSGSKEGYFETREIRTLLDYLRILDNPRQDIPFTAILTSCFCGLTSEQLARISCEGKGSTFYEKTCFYLEFGSDNELKLRLRTMLDQYETFRKKVPYTAIHALLWDLMEETGYKDYVAALPAGEQRKANLEMLVEKAVSFESTSYKGLFHFVRYIEQLHKYDVDYGEASVLDEQADTVRLMSIHKSKGLEFPIVFVAGMSKRFNTQDIKGSIVIHPELGVGMDAVDAERRTKAPTILKRVMQREVLMENVGEELRVLYVALTRAKEKLILTGTISNLEQKIRKFEDLRTRKETELPFSRLARANSYFDWILPALYRNAAFAPVLEEEGIAAPFMNPLYDRSVPIRVYRVGIGQIVAGEEAEEISGVYTKELLRDWNDADTYDEQMKEQIKEQFEYHYPYEREQKLKQKLTVSELKKRAYLEEEAAEFMLEEEEIVPLLPKFLREEEVLTGALRGSAYHKVLEILDFSKVYESDSLREYLEEQKESGKLSEEMRACIREADILTFLESPLGRRMRQAAEFGNVKTEQPFVLGIDVKELYPMERIEETVLIQGIIDVWFEEAGELVVLDYKTDFVFREEILIERYRAQLEYYARALEQLTGKRVKERWIYSFAMRKGIQV